MQELAKLNRVIPAIIAIEKRANIEQRIRFEAVENAGGDAMCIPCNSEIDRLVDEEFKDEEADAIRAFNSFEGTKKHTAEALADMSSKAAGFLSFIDPKARSALPPFSTVKPDIIKVFEYFDEDNTAAAEGSAKPLKIFQAGSASAKSAAAQALERIESQQYHLAESPGDEDGDQDNPGDSVMHQRFGTKGLVYPADLRYYNDFKTVKDQAILHEVRVKQYEQMIESDGKGFSWWINPQATEQEIALQNSQMIKGIEEAEKMRSM